MGFASQFILLSVIIGLAFYDPPQTPGGIQTMKTALFQNIVATYYLSFIVAIYLFCDLFLVYDRESQDGLYGSSSFILSIFFSYLPLHLIFPTIYAIVFYFLAGFRSSNLVSALFVYIGTNVLQQLGSFGYASIWAALNRNFAQASLYANGFVIMFVLSAGYLILPDSIPVYVKWIRWLNPYFYAFVWTAKSQFESRRLTCTEPQCNGEAILTALQIPLESPKWVYAIGLAAYSAITYLIAVLVLHWSNNGGIRHASKKESTDVKAEKGQLPDAPFASPAILSLQDVKTFSGDKPILDIPFASFSSNTLTGILGPSGSGKSTTLSLLSGHLSSSLTCHGAVTLNGRPISSSDVACIAFVPQSDDHLLPAL